MKNEKYFFINTSDHNTSEQYYFKSDELSPSPKLIIKRERGVLYSVNSWDGKFYNHTNKNAEDFKIDICDNLEDQNWYKELIVELVSRHLKVTVDKEELFVKQSIIFCDWLKPGADPTLYEESKDMTKAQQLLNDYLDELLFRIVDTLIIFSDLYIYIYDIRF